MSINRHNYEEFFILYMDNELRMEDRRQVEDFVAQYPDLKEELDHLMQFKLQPDTSLEFPGKEELWKGSTLIHLGNQSEWLLLYMDEELSPPEKVLVEEYLREDAGVREELIRLQKIKLIPESIIFDNKEILYRKEEKERRFIPVFYFRIAAAIILAAIGLGIFFIFNKRGSDKLSSAPMADNKKQKSVENRYPVNTVPVTDPTVKNEVPEIRKEKETGLASNDQKEKRTDKKNREDKLISDGKESITMEKGKEEKKALTYTKPVEEIRNTEKNKTIPDLTNPVLPPSDIKTAVYNPNEELEAENGGGKKNRHRGIFRTIARTFEKRTKVDPTEDDKLLMAGFRINLK